MYAGMTANWWELTRRNTLSSGSESLPLFMCAFSSDKGTEDITSFTADSFYDMYGKAGDFFKYGQPLIQAHRIVNAGGRVLGKRIVARDAALANLIICAEVSQVDVQKTDENGNLLYLNTDGSETTDVTGTPATIPTAKIKYSAQTVTSTGTGIKNLNTYESEVDAEDTATGENAYYRVRTSAYENIKAAAESINSDSKFVLFIVTDNGRGVSSKKVRISANYNVSRNLSFCMYSIEDIEDTNTMEKVTFSIDPDVRYASGKSVRNMALVKNTMTQLNAEYNATGMKNFIAKIAEISGYTIDELLGYDVLFGKNHRGVALTGIEVDPTGLALDHDYGLELQSGTNGSFADAPFTNGEASDAWTEMATAYFKGYMTDEIYDLDIHKIDFIVDANYPRKVKDAITELAMFRQDAFFFRDFGTNVWSYDDIYNIVSDADYPKTAFAGDYMTTYEVVDSYSKKQIRVTMLYSIAEQLVNYYTTNVAAPLAGEFNGFTITDAIEGTINFLPRKTPKVDQKQDLDDLRVNFANYANPNSLVVQSTYTSQDHYGPLSFSNNVITTQMVVKAIRTYMPKIRFQITSDDDFNKYKQLIEDNVISKYAKYFRKIELIYTADDDMTAQHIFNADLRCWYFNFAQHENFNVYAIEGAPSESGELDTSDYILNAVQ